MRYLGQQGLLGAMEQCADQGRDKPISGNSPLGLYQVGVPRITGEESEL